MLPDKNNCFRAGTAGSGRAEAVFFVIKILEIRGLKSTMLCARMSSVYQILEILTAVADMKEDRYYE